MVARTLLILVGMAACMPHALAQDEAEEAKSSFQKANRFFEAGEYEAALPLYEQAYALSNRRPSTIRALAQCERALKLYERAIAHFREYLETQPEDAERIIETLELLEELREASEATPVPPPPPPPEVAPPPPLPTTAPPPPLSTTPPPPEQTEDEGGLLTSPWFWGIVGAVAIGGGIGLGVALSGTEDPYGGSTGVVLIR